MKRKTNLGSLIGTVFLVGMLATFLSSDGELKELFRNLEIDQIEALLRSLNLVLGFIGLLALLIFLFYRAAKGGEEKRLEPGRGEEDQEGDPEARPESDKDW